MKWGVTIRINYCFIIRIAFTLMPPPPLFFFKFIGNLNINDNQQTRSSFLNPSSSFSEFSIVTFTKLITAKPKIYFQRNNFNWILHVYLFIDIVIVILKEIVAIMKVDKDRIGCTVHD